LLRSAGRRHPPSCHRCHRLLVRLDESAHGRDVATTHRHNTRFERKFDPSSGCDLDRPQRHD
ncbi:MAG: hypothetical protein L0H96_26265, partial [Humibacillus sp.]|nr:hypothetical protein [Humibacillus sp.]